MKHTVNLQVQFTDEAKEMLDELARLLVEIANSPVKGSDAARHLPEGLLNHLIVMRSDGLAAAGAGNLFVSLEPSQLLRDIMAAAGAGESHLRLLERINHLHTVSPQLVNKSTPIVGESGADVTTVRPAAESGVL